MSNLLEFKNRDRLHIEKMIKMLCAGLEAMGKPPKWNALFITKDGFYRVGEASGEREWVVAIYHDSSDGVLVTSPPEINAPIKCIVKKFKLRNLIDGFYIYEEVK